MVLENQKTDKIWKCVKVYFQNLYDGVKNTTKQIIRSSFEKYESGKYQKVVEELKNINPIRGTYKDVLLLRGLSLYKLGNTAPALQTLDLLIHYLIEKIISSNLLQRTYMP